MFSQLITEVKDFNEAIRDERIDFKTLVLLFEDKRLYDMCFINEKAERVDPRFIYKRFDAKGEISSTKEFDR